MLYAAEATSVFGNWTVQADPAAAGGARLQSTNLGAAKVTPALAAPGNYVEMTFTAEAGRAYRLWVRGKAEGNNWANDSVHVQFDQAVNASGAADLSDRHHRRAPRSTSRTAAAAACPAGDGRTTATAAACRVRRCIFATTGPQRIRIQTREDGIAIDQIVLSSSRFLSAAPGGPKNDTTILAEHRPGRRPIRDAEVVLYAADAPAVAGAWIRPTDPTAAGGARLQNPNAGAPKLTGAAATRPTTSK